LLKDKEILREISKATNRIISEIEHIEAWFVIILYWLFFNAIFFIFLVMLLF
jgi:hypothetical protein